MKVKLLLPERPAGAYFKAKASEAGDTLELDMYDQIGMDYWTGDGITSKNVKAQLDGFKGAEILVRINSPGGDAFEGVAICNILRGSKKPVNVVIDGIAASAASIIAMAGTTITMAKNATMMVHNAWGFCQGNARDMTKMGLTLAKVDEAIGQTYVERTGKSAAEIKTLMDEETWMTAADCMESGFATALEEHNPKAMALGRKFAAMAGIKKPTTKPVKAAAAEPDEATCECLCESCMGGDCSDCSHDMCNCENCEDCPMRDTPGESADPDYDPAAATQVEIAASLKRIADHFEKSTVAPAPVLEPVAAQVAAPTNETPLELLEAQLALAKL